jgi:dTDP-4-amino-4,6-dideoxygalactose transaminase
MGLGLGEGHVAFVPSITFVATANASRYVGAEVVFTDVDPDSGLMRPRDLQAALESTPNARGAVFPVHLNGQCVDLDAIAAVARGAGLKVVEDACHAVGGTIPHQRTTVPVGGGQVSDACVFSFHPVKTVTTGEGGAITTRDASLARRLRMLRSHGIERRETDFQDRDLGFDATGSANPWYYEMHDLGFNYRITDFQCALGITQLAKLARFVERRRSLCGRYDERLAKLAPTVRPVKRNSNGEAAWHLYPVLIDFDSAGLSRARLMERLRDRGIGTQVHYIPVHRQPYYRRRYGEQALPGADRYYARVLSLPLSTGMGPEDVDRVVDVLGDALRPISGHRH